MRIYRILIVWNKARDLLHSNVMRSTYMLLVRSKDNGRSIMETVLCALLTLSAVISIWQFIRPPNPLPIHGTTTLDQGRIPVFALKK